MTRFLLVRHATTDSVGKRLSGRAPDVHLNATGKQEAERLAQCLSSLSIAAIYSSPLERAMETAEFLAKPRNQQVIIGDHFLEIDFGAWTNCTFESLQEDAHFHRFNTFRSSTRVPGGESMAEAQLRFVKGMEQLQQHHQQQTIVIVSHSDMIKAALAFYAGIHLDMFQRLEIYPASVSVMEVFEETARIITLNHTGDITF